MKTSDQKIDTNNFKQNPKVKLHALNKYTVKVFNNIIRTSIKKTLINIKILKSKANKLPGNLFKPNHFKELKRT